MCLLKSIHKLTSIAAAYPDRAEWWAEYDKGVLMPSGKRYYMLPDGGYKALIERAKNGELPPEEVYAEDLECGCTD